MKRYIRAYTGRDYLSYALPIYSRECYDAIENYIKSGQDSGVSNIVRSYYPSDKRYITTHKYHPEWGEPESYLEVIAVPRTFEQLLNIEILDTLAAQHKEMPVGKKSALKRAIKAEIDYEGLDEDEIMEAEYATIEVAIDGVDKLSAWVDAIKAGIEEYKQDWSPWGGKTSEWEMFGGPDDAEAFTDSVYDITSELEKISRTLGDVLNVYIYPEGV